jgi:hypothetical protein
MLENYLPIPILMVMSVLQMSVVSRIQMNNGSADLILLSVAVWGILDKKRSVFFWALFGGVFISFISAMPIFTPIIPYLFTALITQFFQERIWQAPIISIIVAVFFGTLFQHTFTFFVLTLNGLELGWLTAVQAVTLPSLFLNYLLLLPVFVLINDIHKWITKEEIYD